MKSSGIKTFPGPPLAPNRKVILAGEPTATEIRNRAERTPAKEGLRASLMKNFHVTEKKYVQLRLEAYGVTNSPQWGLPNTSFGDTSFGQITTSTGNRTLQIAAKFYY